MIFGAHVSVSGGYDKALDYAQSVGCECIQIFAKSPGSGEAPRSDPRSPSSSSRFVSSGISGRCSRTPRT